MKLYEQAQLILAQEPLPDDAPEQLDKLLVQAKGEERELINFSYEALYAAASKEQFLKWNS